MDYRIATREIEPQAIVSIRGRCTPDALPASIKSAFADILGKIRLLGISPTGAPFVIYHEFSADTIDAEVSVPVPVPIVASGRMHSRLLPAMTVARTLHVGPYEQLGDAHAALSAWIAANGCEVVGPVRERYLNGPGDVLASSEYRTELEMPIVPLPVVAAV